jgi:integrase
MAITKLGEGKYLIRVYKGRDPVTRKRYSANETFRGSFKEAEKREQVLKVEACKHPARGSPNKTVSELIELYLKATANRRSELTHFRPRELFDRYVVPYIGGIRISKVDTSIIQRLLDFLYAPKKGTDKTQRAKKDSYGLGLSAGTVRRIREQLSAVFNFALRSKLVEGSPVSDSIPPRRGPARANSLTVEEAWALVSVCNQTWYGSAFTFDLQTGLRPGELMGLIWDDIDFVGKTLRVERACKWLPDGSRCLGDVKRPRSERVIELCDEHIIFLEEHREKLERHAAEKKKSGGWRGEPKVSEWLMRERPRQSHLYGNRELVFPSMSGQLPEYYPPHRAFKFLLKTAGLTGDRLNLRWYDLRHTHATILLTLGVPRHEVAERLGHTVKTLDNVYSHTLPGRQRRASSLFLSLIPIKITAPVSRGEIRDRAKQTAASYGEDMEPSLIKLIGYTSRDR